MPDDISPTHAMSQTHGHAPEAARASAVDWRSVASLVLLSREIDTLEETELVPGGEMAYQFSARGHDMAQVLLGLQLTNPNDSVCGYYRSRPVLLALGLEPADALAASLGRVGSYSDGRDIGAVFNLPGHNHASALPMSGGVGTQFTPAAGWAAALQYRSARLGETACDSAIAVALGGDASVATNGFWSALTLATTLKLPMLFYIEDNGYGISVPSRLQTPGGDIAANLESFRGLRTLSGGGSDPVEAAQLIEQAVRHVRHSRGPCLLRLVVPRLRGHSFQDTQAYKSTEQRAAEQQADPLLYLERFLVPSAMEPAEWGLLQEAAKASAGEALAAARARNTPDPATLTHFVTAREGHPQTVGGRWTPADICQVSPVTTGPRINMLTAIRRTLEAELASNPRMLVFGEDVGAKGGVHAATLGLQEKFGADRVFDTSLSEEGIIGRAVGMALAGLLPVPEIQFRKYADPAMEQINDCGTMRWRTNNRFAAPMVLRIPVGYSDFGDPWHSQTNEVQFIHAPGWRVAAPSNAQDAVGLLRAALRGNDPVVFLEHRALLDAASARRPYPGDQYCQKFGQARITAVGSRLTIVTWGALLDRCEQVARDRVGEIEVIDLRTLMPWDRETVMLSVRKTHRCLIVHEDTLTAGFGAELAATIACDAFLSLDAPVTRLAMPDIPCPHHPVLLAAAAPSVDRIRTAALDLIGF